MLLVLVAVIVAAAPFWFGIQAEKTYNNLIQQISKSGSGTFTTRSYERGWLRSSAETLVALPGLPLDMLVRHNISHGPLAIDKIIRGNLVFTPAAAFISSGATLTPRKGATAGMVKDLAKYLPPMTAETMFGLTGGGAETEINVAPMKRKTKDGEINWHGLTGTLVFRGDGRVNTQLSTRGISLLSENGPLSVSNISFQSDARGDGGIMFGNSSLTVAKMDIGPDVSVKGLRFTTTAKPAGNNINSTINYQVKDITVGTDHYGPGQLTLQLRKLNAAALRRFEQKVNGISKRGLAEEQRQMMVAAETMKLIASLSKSAPELEVTKLSFKAREGELTGTAKLVLDGSKLNVAENMMLLLRALRGDAELSIPPSMVKAFLTPRIRSDIENYKRRGILSQREANKLTPKVMSRIVDEAYPSYLTRNGFTKLLVPSGAYYTITASFRQGKFLVNNRPLNQPLLGFGRGT
jgi:uncharacterized protein YdgA (DUF945 family)